MGDLTDEQKERMRDNGHSEQGIAFADSSKQKDWEPILKDPDTPEEVITSIVDSLTFLPLKMLAFKHPNISEKSQRYMIDKADKKEYLKEIIEAFLANPKSLTKDNWKRL